MSSKKYTIHVELDAYEADLLDSVLTMYAARHEGVAGRRHAVGKITDEQLASSELYATRVRALLTKLFERDAL